MILFDSWFLIFWRTRIFIFDQFIFHLINVATYLQYSGQITFNVNNLKKITCEHENILTVRLSEIIQKDEDYKYFLVISFACCFAIFKRTRIILIFRRTMVILIFDQFIFRFISFTAFICNAQVVFHSVMFNRALVSTDFRKWIVLWFLLPVTTEQPHHVLHNLTESGEELEGSNETSCQLGITST